MFKIMAKENVKEEKKPLFKGICDRENCDLYMEKEEISFAHYPDKMIIELCCYGGTKRSFGCMSSCPNGGAYKKTEEDTL